MITNVTLLAGTDTGSREKKWLGVKSATQSMYVLLLGVLMSNDGIVGISQGSMANEAPSCVLFNLLAEPGLESIGVVEIKYGVLYS